MNTFYAIKREQSHVYNKNGKRLFITKLLTKATPVVMVKTQAKDGYEALQVAVGDKKKGNKPLQKHCQKIGFVPMFLREIGLSEKTELKSGDTIKVSQVLKVGDKVRIRAVSKGKGFAGAMKRWGFAGGPRTHGQSDRPRSVGSIGQGTDPGRVWKGKKMPGRMGNKTIGIRNGIVVHISSNEEEIWITGSVPGARGNLVEIGKIGESKFVGLPEEKTEIKKETKKNSIADQPVEEQKADDQEIKTKPVDEKTTEVKKEKEDK